MSQHRQLHLNLNIYGAGAHAAAWLWPGNDPLGPVSTDYFVKLARLAEAGTFDAVFFADRPAFPEKSVFRPFPTLEPTILLATIAAHTRHIGLLATISSSYNEPYNIARRYASLDLVSHGRAGVNIVTSADNEAARNFGLDAAPSHADRYRRADEFSRVLKDLWNSWLPGGVVADRNSGRYFDTDRIRPIEHHGEFFSVRGPLNVPPGPQGRPVIVQAGGSPAGLDLAAHHADAVFTLATSLDEARDYAGSLRARLGKFGRRPEDVRIFPGLVTTIGDTEQSARRRQEELAELVPVEQGLNYLSDILQTRFSAADLDHPLPDNIIVPENGMTTFALNLIRKARENRLTVRQLIRSQNGGGSNHKTIVGTPEQIAAHIVEWFDSGAIDGFNLMPDVLPSGLETFVEQVVPLLRRAGIFREHYEGKTLRENLGLARPAAH